MTLIKRTLLGFLLAGSLGTVAGCSDKKEPEPVAEPEDDDDSDDFADEEDDSTGEMIDAGGKSDAGKKDAGKDGGKDGGTGSTTTVRGMDAGGGDEEDGGSTTTPRPQPGEVTTGPGTATVTTVEGATIYLDNDCPPVISTARNNPRFQGCCLPSGQCGATGYGVKDLTVAFQCRPYEDPALSNWVIQTSIPDEVKSCTIPQP
jgi:hypothetical protein